MEFLADESCDFAVVRALRNRGYDVLAIRENCPGIADTEVAAIARKTGRVLLTEDKDFGELVFAGGPRQGVILLRVPVSARNWMVATLVDLVKARGEGLHGSFVVVRPGKIRTTYYDEET